MIVSWDRTETQAVHCLLNRIALALNQAVNNFEKVSFIRLSIRIAVNLAALVFNFHCILLRSLAKYCAVFNIAL